MIQLSNIPGTFSTAWDINNSGQIVGQYKDTFDTKTKKAFSGPGGDDSPYPGEGVTVSAHAINDNGQVTGYGTTTATTGITPFSMTSKVKS